MRKVLALLLALVFMCSIPLSASADGAEISLENCQAAVLYNVENDKLLFELNTNMALPPASTVKLMTALVAYEALSDRLDSYVTITSPMIRSVTGNYIGLKKDEVIKVDDLFYGMLLRGANDAAHALAILSHGTLEDFVVAMNEYASAIGLEGTVYKNVTGMHDSEMITTASDTLRVAKKFFENEYLMTVSSKVKHIVEATNLVGSRNLYNRNYLVSKYSETRYFYSNAKGMNSGSTSEAGYCCVSSASEGGLSYIALIMGASEQGGINYAFENCGKLLRYGIGNFGYIELIDQSKAVCELPVTLSDDADYVMLVPSENLIAYMPLGLDIAENVTFSYLTEYESLEAPVTAGEVVGKLNVIIDGEIIGHVDLVTKQSVERSELQYVFSRIEHITSSRVFRATLVTAILLSGGYLFVCAYFKKKKKRKRGKYYIN